MLTFMSRIMLGLISLMSPVIQTFQRVCVLMVRGAGSFL